MTQQHSPTKQVWRTVVTIALCLMVYFALVLLQSKAPRVFLYLVAEDWWGEYATAVAYLTACGILVSALYLAPSRRTPGYLLMAFGFFFIGMEEISWAQRLLGIETPHVLSQINYQSEINFHNSVRVDFMTWFCYGLIGWIFVLPLVTSRSRTVARWVAALGIPGVRLSLVPPFVLALVFLLWNRLENDELGELVLSVAFVNWAVDVYVQARGESRRRPLSMWVVASAVAALITGVTAALVAAGADANNYRYSVRYSAMVAYPSAGYYDQAGVLFRHMISEPHPIYEDALYEYGLFLNRIRHPEAGRVLQTFLAQKYRAAGEDVHDDEHRRAGVVFKLLNDRASADRAFRRALEKATQRLQQAPPQSKAGPLFSLSKTYFEMGDFGLALQHADEARRLSQGGRDKLTLQGWMEDIKRASAR